MPKWWTDDDLSLLNASSELEVAVRDTDGNRRTWTPIWVVCAEGQVYVRSWHRRETGWFGHVIKSRQATIRVPGLEVDVLVADLGRNSIALTALVDSAYRTKYGAGAASMVTTAAAATTLQLRPEQVSHRDGPRSPRG